MTLRFGTDGMRGDARSELLPGPVRALTRAAALVLGPTGFAVGRDTRQSGPDLTAAVHDGVAAAGGNSVDLGVVPTPAVARWCDRHDVAGAMISASHNPWHDNGVKFFAPGGVKLDDARQDDIQQRFEAFLAEDGEPAAVATVVDQHEAAARDHVDAVVRSLDGRSLAGLRLVVDAANGAASAVAPAAFQTLGAAVTMLHDSPDGTNINAACGSTHPADLQAAVVAEKADLGGQRESIHRVEFRQGEDPEALAQDRIVVVPVAGRLPARVHQPDHGRSEIGGAIGVRAVVVRLGGILPVPEPRSEASHRPGPHRGRREVEPAPAAESPEEPGGVGPRVETGVDP